ncbi:MAG: hypothetical protein AAGA30_21300, partial [Planctomycetota bacterium]
KPMPDNESVDDSDTEAKLARLIDDTNPALKTSQDSESKIEQIDQGKMDLMEQKAKLQKAAENIEKLIEDWATNEKARGQRFRKLLTAYNLILKRFEGMQFERPDSYFGRAMESLDRLKAQYLVAANRRSAEQFEKRLNELIQIYPQLSNSQDRLAVAKLGQLVGWLDDAGQAEDLVAAVRAQHSHPNLYLEITSQFVNQFANRSISQKQKVNEQILNRLIRGVAYVNGNVSVQFVPDRFQARTAIRVDGTIDSDTYTRAGKLTAYAGATGQYSATREIFGNVGGLFACEVQGDLNLSSYFKCIDSRSRLVQRIARKQYLKTKQQSEAISSRRTRKKILNEFETESDGQILDAYKRLDGINDSQFELGRFIPETYLSTTSDRLVVTGHKSTSKDLAAPNLPVESHGFPIGFAAKLHETLLSNYVSPLVAGKRFKVSELGKLLQEALNRPVTDDPNAEDIEILFDDA